MSFLQFPPCLAVTSFLQRLTISGSGPAKSSPLDSVNGNGEGERRIAVADFKGKFLVIIFFKNNDSKEFLKAFSDLADLFRGNKIEVWKHFQKNAKILFPKNLCVDFWSWSKVMSRLSIFLAFRECAKSVKTSLLSLHILKNHWLRSHTPYGNGFLNPRPNLFLWRFKVFCGVNPNDIWFGK